VDRALVGISKLLSLVLRHRPERLGLTLDSHGWVDVDTLLAAAAAHDVQLDRETFDRVVRENDKRRFELGDDGRRVRASQGHSVPVDLGLPPVVPPPVLYHGTAARAVDAIRREGIRRGRRTHVHLSADEATARSVGQRHGAPVVLRIDAGRMHRDGHTFVRAANGVWLVEAVPPDYIAS